MNKLANFLSVLLLCVGFVHVASAADLKRESGLIRQLGKLEADRIANAGQPPTALEIRSAAKTIDEYFIGFHREKNVRANKPASDDVFLRRIYLDVVGRIPTLEETVTFNRDKSRDKRAKLIDQLINSEGYVQNEYTFWADLLRVQSNNQSYYGGQPYANFIKDAVRSNKPYKQLVHELLTAEGYPWENGATGFYLRDDGMPLDNMATTVQVFLGTSMQCAQCHDHPFDKWSQYEFYEMAAYTYGIQTRTQSENVTAAMKMLGNEPAARTELSQFARPLSYGVDYSDKSIQLPHDYKYDDAKPKESVKPYTIFGRVAVPGEHQSLRESYADWMTDTQNPRFTLVIANRLWKKVFGIGLIEPVDELTDDSEALHPQLMAYLTYKMEALGYDMKQFQRMLYNTQLYQREVTLEDPPETEPYLFPGPLLHRMTAEQFWDSLVTLIIPEPDYRRGPMSSTSYYASVYKLQNASPEELASMARDMAEYEADRRAIRDKISEAREAGNDSAVERLNRELRALQSPVNMSMMAMDYEPASGGDMSYGYDIPTKDPKLWENFDSGLVRAAELPSPAPAGHFLYQFGQSDRDVTNNRNLEPNIIQVLAMFNGRMFESVIADNSQLMRNIRSVQSPEEKVRLIFLSVLNREPNKSEAMLILNNIIKPAVQQSWEPDYGKVVWALLNTREFSFVQ